MWHLATMIVVAAIHLAACVEALPADTRVGMYWERGRAFFAILEQARTVRLGWVVGPRYGRGFDVPIIDSDDGSPILGPGVCTWVS